MSNSPNMSYVMCENTFFALKQIVESIRDDHYGNDAEFIESLSRDEKYYYSRILALAEQLIDGGDMDVEF